MARCKECIHGECCSVFVPVRTTLCNDNADEMCKLFKPTADVVPKSEYEALKEMLDATIAGQETLQKSFCEKLEVAEALVDTLYKSKTKFAREIFEEIEKIATAEGAYDYVSIQEIAELKKKYIPQECPKCKHFVGCEQANWVRGCEEYEDDSK